MPSKCSVIVVNWNSLTQLKLSLPALLEHGEDSLHEVFVVDNGSFDGSAEYCLSLGPIVRFVQSNSNLGFAAANNLGASLATAEMILFLNPDADVTAGAVRALCAAIAADSRAGAAGARLLNSDGSSQASCVLAFPRLMHPVVNSNMFRFLFPGLMLWGGVDTGDSSPRPRRVEAVSGACLIVRRAIFEAVGGFSEDYFMYSEDVDLCWKMRRAGHWTLHVPEAVVIHHGGKSTVRRRVHKFAVVLQRHSEWICVRKFRGGLAGAAYRFLTGLSACARMAIALPLSVVLSLAGNSKFAGILAKWRHVLSWALGTESWCTRLSAKQVQHGSTDAALHRA